MATGVTTKLNISTTEKIMLNQLTKEKQKRRLNTLPLTAAVIALLRVSACSSQLLTTAKPDNAASTLATAKTDTPKSPLKPTSDVPRSLRDIGKYSKAIYDMAKVHDWTKAVVELAEFKEAIARLPSIKTDKLDTTITALDIAVATQEQSVAMHSANQLSLIAADMNELGAREQEEARK